MIRPYLCDALISTLGPGPVNGMAVDRDFSLEMPGNRGKTRSDQK